MLLEVRTWGSGPRTALLVHGFSDDASTWWRVAPALADQGWTVLAPDLRGHGTSRRAGSYRLEELAQDLVDSLPAGADLVVGHSLGAMALGLAATSLGARRTVFVDPGWLRRRGDFDLARPLATEPAELPPATAVWSAGDVAVDLASNARLDPLVGRTVLADLTAESVVQPPPAVPGAVVLVPEMDPVLPVEAHGTLEALGYEIRTVPGVRHVMHRDDLAAFLAALPLEQVAQPAC